MKARHVVLLLIMLLLCLVPTLGLGSGVSVIPALQAGDTLTVTAVTPIDDTTFWYAIQFPNGTTGYIRSEDIISDMAQEAAYIGNAKTKVFHRPACINLPAEKNSVELKSRDEAVKKGFKPCGNCNP